MRRRRSLLLLVAGVFGAGLVASFWLLGERGDVAVVKIEGGIFDAEPIVRQLHDIKKDAAVPAVVLRVDSPGGSVSASQEVFQAVKDLREAKKVVVSMGTVAASGGYYVSLPAEKIFANAGTVTGSIGVRMELMNAGELLQWAKLEPETLKSGRFKDTGSPFRPLDSEERDLLQDILNQMHIQFKKAVAEERKIPMETVEALADGRIFTGQSARDKGLVDEIGSLQDAISAAGKLAGLQDPKPFYPSRERGGLVDYLLDRVMMKAAGWVARFQWRPLYLL